MTQQEKLIKLLTRQQGCTSVDIAKLAETPVGEYEVIVACGTDPVPHRIPRYLEWDSIANAIRARSNI